MKIEKNNVKDFFDFQAVNWSSNYDEKKKDLISWDFKNRKKIVLSMFNFENAKVLEVGCGPGTFSVEILKKNNKLYGVDISQEMIKESETRIQALGFKANFSVGDISNLNFPKEFFDAVVAVGVLPYVNNDEKAFGELNRVLKNNGILIATVNNKYSFNYLSRSFFNFFLRHFNKKSKLIFQKIRTKAYSEKEIKRVISKNNFEIVDYANCSYKFFPFHKVFPSLFIFFSKKISPKSKLGFLGTEKILKLRKIK